MTKAFRLFGPLFFAVLFLQSVAVRAGDDVLPGRRSYMIDESRGNAEADSSLPETAWTTPDQLLKQGKVQINLLRWVVRNEMPPRPPERYVREFHFGRWINRPSEPSCMNTRALVLVRDSKTRVSMDPKSPCIVDKGAWPDPYTGRTLKDAVKEVQIDHLVPLKNAYISGAFSWPWQLRCAYANFMGNNYHLLPVDGPANNMKSDSAPHEWMPANPAFRCQYLSAWLRVKLIWRLMLSEPEAAAIAKLIKANNCAPGLFKFSARELNQQKAYMQATIRDCPNRPPPPPNPGEPEAASK